MGFPKRPGPLFLLTLFFVAVTGVWLILNRSPPQWDDAWYLTNSLVLFDALDGGLPGYARAYLSMLRIKPPLITVLPTPIYFLFGREPKLAYLVNIAAMPLLFVTLYLIARRLGNRTTGLLAVFVAATMPLLYGLSHWFLVDYLLTALVCLTIWLVFVGLERPDASTFFPLGITFGLGMLLKISYPVYIFLPVLYMLIRLWRTSRLTWTSLLALFAPALVLALPWYAVNYGAAIGRGFFSGFSPEVQALSGTGSVFSIQAVAAYLLSLMNSGASAYYTLLAVVLLPFQPKSGRLILTLWALPFALFLFAPNKDLRLVAPILPVLSLFIACALAKATRGKGRLLAMLLVFPLLAFLCNLFGLGQLAIGPVIFAARELHFASVYKRQRWPHREILEHIVRSARIVNGVKPFVMLATDTPEFNINNFELAAGQYRLPLNIASSTYETDQTALLASLRSASFVVYKDGGTRDPGGLNRLQKVLLQEVETGEGFREIPFDLRLPDGGITRIFQNVSPPGLLSEWAFSRGARPRSPAIDNMQCDFGGQILLTELAVEHTSKTLVLRLRWRCLKPPLHNYNAFVRILGPDQQPVGQLDHTLMDGNPPALSWRPGDEALETMVASLTARQAAGAYQIRLGLFDLLTGERLPVKILSSPKGFATTDNESALLTPATH